MEEMDSALLASTACLWVLAIVVGIISLIAVWKIYSKAGKPGWAAIIPIYNIIVWLEIVGRPLWWVLLLFIPGVNIVITLMISLDLAKSYGKGTGFGLGVFFLYPIFTSILGFGNAMYQGPQTV